MSGESYTAGDWTAAAKPSSVVGWPIVSRPTGRLICDVAILPKPPSMSDGEYSKFYAEIEANARLIAAAPTLLEFAVALDKSWTETFPDGPETAGEGVVQMGEEHRALWLQCRQAISAATGQASTQESGR